MLALLALAAAVTQASPAAVEQARRAFDPGLLAAAERLRVATGSEATLEPRVRRAVTLLVVGETSECLKLSADLPRNRQPDCGKVATRQTADMQKIPLVIPAMVEQMRVVEQRAYAERFTVAEMDAITAFLTSPAGRKFTGEADAVNQDVTVKLRLLLRTTLAGTPTPPAPAAAPEKQP